MAIDQAIDLIIQINKINPDWIVEFTTNANLANYDVCFYYSIGTYQPQLMSEINQKFQDKSGRSIKGYDDRFNLSSHEVYLSIHPLPRG